ncbi:MAG: CHAT domain-containing protein [Saprospirales bacterium]|nr:CHAT domain-containing protein [Saprospirales bacterium]
MIRGNWRPWKKAIDIFERLDTLHANVAYAYKNAGQILEMRLNYPKAIAYFEKALDQDTAHRYTAPVCSFLSDCYYWQEDYENAFLYLKKGLKAGGSPRHRAMLALSGVGPYLKKKDYSNAEKYAREALSLMQQNPDDEIEPGPIYAALAEVRYMEKKVSEAGKYWNLALEATAVAYPEKDREHAKMLVNAGDFFAETGQPEKALQLYQQAIVQVYPNFNSLDLKDNPAPDFAFVESWAMTAPARKARMMAARNELENAGQCYDLALRQIHLLKTTYGSDVARLYMGEYSHGYFEEAIQVQAALYAQKGNPACLERIYQLMEDSKADVLREAVERNRSLTRGALPDTLLQEEADLRLSIAEARSNGANGRLLEMERRYEKVLQALKVLDPRFQGLQPEVSHTPFKEVMQKLAGEKALFLEYFYGTESVYILGIHPQGAFLEKMDGVQALQVALQQYGHYFKDADATLADPAGYFAVAYDLYHLLVPEQAKGLLDQADKLIVVPDGPLGYLPFEALLTESWSGKSYGSAPYLIKKAPIQYSWSAELLWRPAPNREGGAIVQFDPGFPNGERGLAPLLYGMKETAHLATLQRLSGASASLAAFLDWAPRARILHLSTHARAKSGMEPSVEFYDEKLTLPQLYAMLIPCDLVVLSACETSLGELSTGEGIMSHARGFAYAGAASLIAAQWEINESTTAQILAQFYQGLSKKQSRLEALRQAKLQYLEDAPSAAFQSPYYWAGLTFYGQDGTMALPGNIPYWVWGIFLALLLPVAGFFIRRYR